MGLVSKYQELKAKQAEKGVGKVRLMFEDEAGFGRINKPRYCWCRKGMRPTVPCHHIREYRYAFGAFEPETGENFFLVSSKCDTVSMNVFVGQLSEKYFSDHILLCCDRASCHMSKTLQNFDNITIFPLLPYTPEMNPAEQIWRELRSTGFKNEIFHTLDDVVDRLCETICNLSNDTVKSITASDCILSVFLFGISIINQNIQNLIISQK